MTERLTNLADGALMQRVTAADTAAFEVFYLRHISTAHALAFHIVHSRQPADDVCQEAFLSAWRAAGTFNPGLGSARSWILQVVRNRAIDHLRKSRRTAGHEVPDDGLADRHAAPKDEGTESTALRHAQVEETRQLLKVLSGNQRDVIELNFYGGYTHHEIADQVGLPLGTIKARINRGLERMRTADQQAS